MTIFIETFLFLNHYHHKIGLACKVCLQNVSICPCTKPIITIKLLWCTTVVATFLSLNSYEDEKFEKKRKLPSHSVHSDVYAPNRCILYI